MSLVIFDCDGVVLESELLANQAEVNALKELGHNISLEDYIDIALGRHNHQVTILLKEKLGVDLSEQYWKDVILKQQQLFEEHLVPVEGIVEVLQIITTKTCIASSSSMERLNHTLSITNILPYFENNIFSTELVKRGKPFPDIYLYAAEKMKVSAKECIVIEDSLAGIEGALAAGMTVFAFGGGKHITTRSREKLKASGAYLFFDNMHDLPGLLSKFLPDTTNRS
jgi:HAD superfamily hydrolase (TIGR01509 family)